MRSLLAAPVVAALILAGCTGAPSAALDQASTGAAAGFPPVLDLIAGIDAAVASGAAMNLTAFGESDPLGNGRLGAPRTVSVVLQPSTLVGNGTWAEVDGARVAFPDVRVFEGHVEGRDDTIVRLTTTSQWARGVIRINDTQMLVRYGLEGNLPYASAPNVRAPADAQAFSTSSSTMFYDRDGQETHDCLMPVPTSMKPVVEPLPGPTTLDPITARVVLDADQQAYEMLGEDLFPLMVAFLHEVDGIYAHEVAIRFQLVGIHRNTDATYYPDPEENAPLEALASYWNERADVPRDVVHIFTGQPSGYAQANCIGGAGMPEIAYTFTPLNWARDYVVFHEQAFAHELGHIFSAHHHYGNHAEAMWSSAEVRPAGAVSLVTSPQGGLATIMIQGYTPGAKPVFGTVEKSVIRGWAEDHLGQHDG